MCHCLQSTPHGMPWRLQQWAVLRSPPKQTAEILLPVRGWLHLHRRTGETRGMRLLKMLISPSSVSCHFNQLRSAIKMGPIYFQSEEEEKELLSIL